MCSNNLKITLLLRDTGNTETFNNRRKTLSDGGKQVFPFLHGDACLHAARGSVFSQFR